MGTLRSLRPLLDLHMAAVVVMAVVATLFCRVVGLEVDLPADVISIAVIFPVVFTIAEAHTRREKALQSFASLRANAMSLYLAHRDWPAAPNDLTAEGAELVRRLFHTINTYFKATPAEEQRCLLDFYTVVSDLSVSHRRMLIADVQTSELSRVSQFLRDVIADFEQMRNIAQHRTPIALRAFSRFFLTSFPVLFAPYFAYVGYPDHPWLGYMVAAIYSAVLVGLDNIQEQLEHPFDGAGPDDLHLDVIEDYAAILTDSATPGHVRAEEAALPRR